MDWAHIDMPLPFRNHLSYPDKKRLIPPQNLKYPYYERHSQLAMGNLGFLAGMDAGRTAQPAAAGSSSGDGGVLQFSVVPHSR
jgi:hypothetical protein